VDVHTPMGCPQGAVSLQRLHTRQPRCLLRLTTPALGLDRQSHAPITAENSPCTHGWTHALCHDDSSTRPSTCPRHAVTFDSLQGSNLPCFAFALLCFALLCFALLCFALRCFACPGASHVPVCQPTPAPHDSSSQFHATPRFRDACPRQTLLQQVSLPGRSFRGSREPNPVIPRYHPDRRLRFPMWIQMPRPRTPSPLLRPVLGEPAATACFCRRD
jgi:hypothetical protein